MRDVFGHAGLRMAAVGLEAEGEPLGPHQGLHPQLAPPWVHAGHQRHEEAGELVKVGKELSAVVGNSKWIVIEFEESAGLRHCDLRLIPARRPLLFLP